MKKFDVDTLIVGAGTAGCIAALNLASSKSVLLIDKNASPLHRIGEALVPAAKRLFADMGLLDEFESREYLPYYGNQICWGTDKIVENNFIKNIDRHGWYIDRADFELWLRNVALRRGAEIIAPSKIISTSRNGDGFLLKLLHGTKELSVTARTVIDAGGRSAPIARQLGAKRIATDRLVCGWLIINSTQQFNNLSYIEAVSSGWWYAAPMPNKRYVIAFYTDSDLEEALNAKDVNILIQKANSILSIRKLLGNLDLSNLSTHGFTAAHSATLAPCVGTNWLATGDAALCFDPISSQGLFNAIYTGLAAAEAVDRLLDGCESSLQEYARMILSIQEAYQVHYNFYYKAQTKWQNSVFWKRRT